MANLHMEGQLELYRKERPYDVNGLVKSYSLSLYETPSLNCEKNSKEFISLPFTIYKVLFCDLELRCP